VIDLYCERTSAGLLAEPVNVATSGAFVVAAWLARRAAKRARVTDRGIDTLIQLTAVIALGSVAFHAFATDWSRFLDVVPILLFQLLFLALYLRRVAGWRLLGAVTAATLLVAAAVTIRLLSDSANGSMLYVPALVALAVLAADRLRRLGPEPYLLVLATATFAGSLAMRSIDLQLCGVLPVGTHFGWHLLNGLVLYLCLRVLIVSRSWSARRIQGITT
jgi:hypothetical protein